MRNVAADPTPVDHPMAKALRWLVGKWPMWQLVDLVVLLSLLHWSTLQTEQGHSSWSVMRRYHPTCFWQTLVCRAFCHMIRPLFRAAKEDKVVSKLRKEILVLVKRAPERSNGVAAMLKDNANARKIYMADSGASAFSY